MNDIETTAAETTEVTAALEETTQAELAQGRLAEIQKDEAMSMMLEMGKMAGRIQSAQIFGHVSDSIQVSQLQKMKEIYKVAGITWEEACNIIGINRRTADRYLKLAAELGADFFGHCDRLGISFRALEAARQLPEPVREKLTQGEVVDLEAVSKSELTRVIKELADERATEKAEAEKEAKKKDKALEKAQAASAELTEKVEALETENQALSSGLDASDAGVWQEIQAIEKEFVMGIIRIRNTRDVPEMSGMLYNRLAASLLFMEALARDTSMHLATKREDGELPGEDWGFEESRQLAQQLAGVDGTEPYPV